MINILLIWLFFVPLQLMAQNALQKNILTYKGGQVQITSGINEYENLVAGKPIQGSVMVTHDSHQEVDLASFRLGEKPLKVQFVQSTPMSQFDPIVVSIYSFQIDGLPQGNHTLPPIRVKVGGQEYQAPPLFIQVAGK